MKKQLLLSLLVAPSLLFAQTSLITDNFDSYTAGNAVGVESGGVWVTWSGGTGTAEDPLISTTFASSGANSMHVTNNGPGMYTNDIVLINPSTYTDGIYELKMKYYIETGSGGYFNMGGNWVTGGTGYTYGIDVFFNGDGSGNVTSASNGVFTYPQDEWVDVSVVVNVTTDMADLYINSSLVHSQVWNSAPGFGCVDVFGIAFSDATNATEITSDFYVDDVELLDWTGVGLSEQELASSLLIMPNPSNGKFEIRSSIALENATISIVDLSGKEVYSSTTDLTSNGMMSFDLNLLDGLYFVNISDGNHTASKKVVIKN